MAVGALTAGQAQAVVVNVGGQDWDVTTFTGSYNTNPDNQTKFGLLTAGGVMPWWNDSSLAESFATAVGSSLDAPNSDGNPGYGAAFAYQFLFVPCGNCVFTAWVRSANGDVIEQNVSADNVDLAPFYDANTSWAQASLIPFGAPVPSPLPALGTAAAFGYSHKLRKRIKNIDSSASSTYTL